MKEALIAFFGPQERRLTIAAEGVVVRTLADDADMSAFKLCDRDDAVWLFVVRCTFYEKDGSPCFDDSDVPVLKAAPRISTMPLVRAVYEVNGFDQLVEQTEKG